MQLKGGSTCRGSSCSVPKGVRLLLTNDSRPSSFAPSLPRSLIANQESGLIQGKGRALMRSYIAARPHPLSLTHSPSHTLFPSSPSNYRHPPEGFLDRHRRPRWWASHQFSFPSHLPTISTHLLHSRLSAPLGPSLGHPSFPPCPICQVSVADQATRQPPASRPLCQPGWCTQSRWCRLRVTFPLSSSLNKEHASLLIC